MSTPASPQSSDAKHIVGFNISLVRNDDIPAFGGFLRCEEQKDTNHVILLNVQACMSPTAYLEDGDPIHATRDDRRYLIVTTLMHEFGHLLEVHMRLPVNEDAIERACESWESAFNRAGQAVNGPYVDDLASLVRRLARVVRQHNADDDLAAKAMAYLKRTGLDGAVFRGDEKTKEAEA